MVENQRDSKALKISVSIQSALFEEAKKKASSNFSAYVTKLIENDLGQTQPTPMAPDVIVGLAKTLIGELDAQDLGQSLNGQDQRRILQEWLRSLMDRPARERLDIRAAIKAQESPAQKILREAREREKNSGVA